MFNSTYGIWRLNSHVVLPLVFDDALSYLELVGMLIERCNHLTEDILALEKIIKEIEQGEKIEEILNQISQIKKEQLEIEEEISLINQKLETINAIEKRVSDNEVEIVKLKTKINDIWIDVTEYIRNLTAQNNIIIENLIEDIKKMVTEQVCTRNGMLILVQNPVQGIITSLNECLLDIRRTMVAVGGVTSLEYDNYYLTMDEYENLHLTMIQYDYSFRWFMLNKDLKITKNKYRDIRKKIEALKGEIENNTVGIDPTTYERTTAFILAEKAITSFYWGCTILQYKTYNLTMAQYEEKNIAAIKYDEEMLLIMLLEKMQNLSIEWEYVDKEYGTLRLYGTYRGEDGIIIFPENLDYPIYVKAETEYTYNGDERKLIILDYTAGQEVKIVLYYKRRIEKLR